jgi:hypothetical protein
MQGSFDDLFSFKYSMREGTRVAVSGQGREAETGAALMLRKSMRLPQKYN